MRLSDGTQLHSAEEVHDAAVTFFQNLLTASLVDVNDGCLRLLEPAVTDRDNELLCAPPTIDEVKAALWSIPQDSSPGPDGFSAIFFFFYPCMGDCEARSF